LRLLGIVAAVLFLGGCSQESHKEIRGSTTPEKKRDLTLPPPFQKLVELHNPLGKPRPTDWLSRYSEQGQTYADFRQSNPVRADNRRRTLYIQPLGDFSQTQRKIVRLTANYMGIYFQLPILVREDLPLSLISKRARRQHPQWGVPQILTTYVRNELLKPQLPDDAVALIAFTASDLWPGEGWNFVFGEASLDDRVGVWSINRFGDPETNLDTFRLSLRRTLGTATHETGHMFSMQHCIFYECSMCGSNSLEESDRYPLWLCPQCLAKLCYATGAEPEKRFQELIVFAKANGLKEAADFWQKSLSAIQKK
jgi:archaemetzincin